MARHAPPSHSTLYFLITLGMHAALRVAASPTPPVGQPNPPSFEELECALHTVALSFATSLVSTSPAAIRDSLNLDTLCAGAGAPSAATLAALAAGAPPPSGAPRRAARAPRPEAPSLSFFVSPSGNDAAAGTLTAPFATLRRARAAVVALPLPTRIAAGGVVIYLRGGTHYLDNATLALDATDSYTSYAAYNSEPAVIAGARLLTGLAWAPAPQGGGVQAAPVSLPDPRLQAWMDAGSTLAPPPPVVNELYINGVRQLRARYPNGNPGNSGGVCFSKPQRDGEGCAAYSTCSMGDGGSRQPAPPAVAHISNITPNRGNSPTQGCPQCTDYGTFAYSIFPPPPNHPVYNSPLPGSGWTNSSHWTFWGSLFDRSGAVVVNTGCDPHWTRASNWTHPELAVLQTFHMQLWGGWSFAVSDVSAPKPGQVRLGLAYGGYQEARGGAMGSGGGGHFYVENVLQELDAPGEWYYDPYGRTLYSLPNATDLSTAAVSVPLLQTLVSVVGSPGAPVVNVSFTGLTFTQSSSAFLEAFEVPSGGDWSIHRGAALFVQEAEAVTVANCLFTGLGGNALMFSNHVAGSVIADNEFVQIGESGIAFLGSAVLADASAPTYPVDNLITGNHIHEIGLLGKQTACFISSLSANSTVQGNVCYNVPRSAVSYSSPGNNTPAAIVTVRTAGAPASLRLSFHDGVGSTGLVAGCRDVALVKLEVLDAAGVVVPDANNTVTFFLTGDAGAAEIAGTASGDAASLVNNKSPVRPVFHGLALAVVTSSIAKNCGRMGPPNCAVNVRYQAASQRWGGGRRRPQRVRDPDQRRRKRGRPVLPV